MITTGRIYGIDERLILIDVALGVWPLAKIYSIICLFYFPHIHIQLIYTYCILYLYK